MPSLSVFLMVTKGNPYLPLYGGANAATATARYKDNKCLSPFLLWFMNKQSLKVPNANGKKLYFQ